LDRRKAALLLVLVGVLWSLGGLLIKFVDWHPLAIASSRSAIAGVVVLLFLRRPRFTWSSAQIGGAVSLAGTVILFVLANKLTTAANAILLQYTCPVYVAIFGAWFLGERTTAQDWILLAAIIGGIALFFADQLTFYGLWGNISAIASGVCFGWFALFIRKQKNQSALESVVLGNLLAAAIGLPFMFQAMPSLPSVMVLIFLGVVQLGLPYVLYVIAGRYVTALDLILIPAIEPILNPIWVFLFIHEVPGRWAMLGGVIVLASVIIRGLRSAANAKAIDRRALVG